MEDQNNTEDVKRTWRTLSAESEGIERQIERIGLYTGVIISAFAGLEMTGHDNITGLLAFPSVALIVKGIRVFNAMKKNSGPLKESVAKMRSLHNNSQT